MLRYIDHERRNQYRGCLCLLLLLLAIGLGAYFGVSISNAASITVGTVNTSSNNLNVRSGPGTTYSSIGSLAKGSRVTILGEEGEWYRIIYGSGEGYVSKGYIANVQTIEQDDTYINSLTAQGFPYSYAVQLDALHQQYPNWVFEPVLTGLEWSTVIKEESVLGRNLVQAANNDAQKSTAPGAYNWSANRWIGYDGAGWVCASEGMIAYCMDPRNFLNADNIFQFATNEYQSYQDTTGVAALLKGTFMSGNYVDTDGATRNYAETFVTIGQSVQVSPYHLASRCRQEQGINGTSGSISGTVSGYVGYFNYFNIHAYPSGNLTSIQNGLRYAVTQGWNSRYKSIQGGAKIVGNNYVLLGQNTVYFEKFNVVNSYSGLFGHQYMTNVQAAISEGKNIKKAYTDSNAAIVFRIPIYNNMPESSCTIPTGGNPNNWLKSLTLTGYNLTPAFSGATTEYSLIVGTEVSSVSVSGAPVVSTSSVTGTGTINLNYGSNIVSVVCTAQNGSTRTHTINIVRQEPADAGTGETPGTPETPDDPVTPTPTVRRGDVNGDGNISLIDLVMVKRHILEYKILEGEQFTAADIDMNGTINLIDYVKIKRHLLGYESIE